MKKEALVLTANPTSRTPWTLRMARICCLAGLLKYCNWQPCLLVVYSFHSIKRVHILKWFHIANGGKYFFASNLAHYTHASDHACSLLQLSSFKEVCLFHCHFDFLTQFWSKPNLSTMSAALYNDQEYGLLDWEIDGEEFTCMWSRARLATFDFCSTLAPAGLVDLVGSECN